ncbi:MauE/DoxX family redox-associated membrane protein [Asanoa iriomotensis]|uniref:Methylamine utilisation protein MauE domain-containing protein n=1 Tax=Asanoa iriomotensis TaxID=234613 RepID=A0ABQ4C140_9ACTN|nr:MauE/DoxX family redox-associated membrane protein [Asanoa iriomotensis]GIF56484.1 hypothetical protein Air01nite_25790 [Asanoa iriomotensis]
MVIALAGQALLGTVFAVSAVAKLRDGTAFRRFAEQVLALRIHNRAALVWAHRAVTLGTLSGELAVAVLLLAPVVVPTLPRWSVGAGYTLAVVLLLAFTAALWLAVRRGVRAGCGCFGRAETPAGMWQVGRNAVLVAIAAIGLLTGSVNSVATPRAGADVVVDVVIGVALAIVVMSLHELTSLFRPGTRSSSMAVPSERKGWR